MCKTTKSLVTLHILLDKENTKMVDQQVSPSSSSPLDGNNKLFLGFVVLFTSCYVTLSCMKTLIVAGPPESHSSRRTILKTQPVGVHRQCTRADKQLSLNVKHHCYGGDETKMVSVNCVIPVLLSWFIMLVCGWPLMLLFLSCKPLFLFQSLHAFCFLSLFICHLL